jgi:hypothetical protein
MPGAFVYDIILAKKQKTSIKHELGFKKILEDMFRMGKLCARANYGRFTRAVCGGGKKILSMRLRGK